MCNNTAICNYSRIASKATVHNLTNLQLHYGRELPNFTSMIEELVTIERKLMYLFTKVLLIFKHFTYIGYRISKEFYSRSNNPMRETR